MKANDNYNNKKMYKRHVKKKHELKRVLWENRDN